jgi:hypothetical protein
LEYVTMEVTLGLQCLRITLSQKWPLFLSSENNLSLLFIWTVIINQATSWRSFMAWRTPSDIRYTPKNIHRFQFFALVANKVAGPVFRCFAPRRETVRGSGGKTPRMFNLLPDGST